MIVNNLLDQKLNDKRLVLVPYNLLFVGEGVWFRVDFDTTDNTVYRNSKHSIPEIQRQFSTPSVSNATSGRRCSLIIIEQTQKQCNLLTNRETLHTKNDFRNVVALSRATRKSKARKILAFHWLCIGVRGHSSPQRRAWFSKASVVLHVK